jgi:hypothetical protein
LEDLKKKFIVDDSFDEKKLAEYVGRLLPFCKISKSGEILVEIEQATTVEKVKLGLAARFVANNLQKEIPSEIDADDLSKFLDIPKNQVAARLNELKDNKFAISVERGLFSINPRALSPFLDEMEAKYRRPPT